MRDYVCRYVAGWDFNFDLIGFAHSMVSEKNKGIKVQVGIFGYSQMIKSEFITSDYKEQKVKEKGKGEIA